MALRPTDRAPQSGLASYWTRDYLSKERFCSFWHQIDELLRLEPESVLEIGPGPGIVTYCLRNSGVRVSTLDVDPSVEPDMVGTVTEMELTDGAVDVVLCAEVLEHMPWEDGQAALREIRRVARTGAVISLPDVTPYVGVSYPLYFGMYVDQLRKHMPPGRIAPLRKALKGEIRWRDFLWTQLVPIEWSIGGRALEAKRPPIPHRPWCHEFDGQHYYEIGTQGYPLERITGAFEDAGFGLVRDFRVPENPWHHFFVLATD